MFMNNLIFKSLFVPGSFSFLLILAGLIVYIFRREERGKYFIIAGLIFYFFFSTTPGADLVISPLEKDYTPISIEEMSKADRVVVLSGGKKADVLRRSEVLRISNFKENNLQLIISGTEAVDDMRNDISAIESFFINRGVPAENIYIEDESKNTRENAEKVVERVGESPFLLVTSAYHMKRSLEEFERLGANPIPAPTDFRKKGSDYEFRDFIPSSENLRKSDLAFHEYLGILYYRIFN